jgi:hypothetical protein
MSGNSAYGSSVCSSADVFILKEDIPSELFSSSEGAVISSRDSSRFTESEILRRRCKIACNGSVFRQNKLDQGRSYLVFSDFSPLLQLLLDQVLNNLQFFLRLLFAGSISGVHAPLLKNNSYAPLHVSPASAMAA